MVKTYSRCNEHFNNARAHLASFLLSFLALNIYIVCVCVSAVTRQPTHDPFQNVDCTIHTSKLALPPLSSGSRPEKKMVFFKKKNKKK